MKLSSFCFPILPHMKHLSLTRVDEVVSEDGSTCVTCPELTWPDNDTGVTCVPIEPTYLTWQDQYGIVLSSLAGLGIVGSLTVLTVVIAKRERRVVKVEPFFFTD